MSDEQPREGERSEPPRRELSGARLVEGYPEWWVSSPALSFFMRHQRLLFGLCALVVIVMLSGGLMISQLSARHGLLVFGSDPSGWSAGSQAALRVEARALSLGHRAAILSAQVRFESSHRPAPPPQTLRQALGLSLQGTVQLPAAPGVWQMIIEAEAISGSGARAAQLKEGLAQRSLEGALSLGERVKLRAQLELNLRPTGATPILSELKPARSPDLLRARSAGESVTIKSFAADQRLSFELPSTLLVVGVDQDGQPAQGELVLSVNGTPHKPLRLSEEGIASLSVTPRSPTIDLELALRAHGGAELSATSGERVWPEAHQFSLTASSQLLESSGGALLSLQSTQAAEGLFVDLWWEGRWIMTTLARLDASGRGQLQLKSPELERWSGAQAVEPALLWVQSYQSPYQPGEVRGGSYLLYRPTALSDEELGAWLLARVAQLKVTHKEWPQLKPAQWLKPAPLRLLLGRIERPLADPQLIINAVASAEATASLMKRDYQASFFIFMACFCALILALFVWLMTAHQRSLRPLHAELNISSQALRSHVALWFAQVAAILIIFFGGMIYLVYTIRW